MTDISDTLDILGTIQLRWLMLTNHTYLIYMNKLDLALNKLQWFLYHKTKRNHTNPSSLFHSISSNIFLSFYSIVFFPSSVFFFLFFHCFSLLDSFFPLSFFFPFVFLSSSLFPSYLLSLLTMFFFLSSSVFIFLFVFHLLHPFHLFHFINFSLSFFYLQILFYSLVSSSH